MEDVNNKKEYKAERFQFILSVNDNIICQRYFKINWFNPDSLHSKELKETIDIIVNGFMGGKHPGFDPGVINGDLCSKSRVYMWYTYDPSYVDAEYVKPLDERWSTTFKFAFLVDEKEVISRVWDGTVYPKAVRDCVDIVNKKTKFEGLDGKMNFETSLARRMVIDKPDLSYIIINLICDVCSSTFSKNYEYTLLSNYGDKTYNMDMKKMYNDYVKETAKSVEKKTDEYFKNLF